QPFPSVSALLANFPSDDVMANDPNITKAPDSQRVSAEQLNVTVPAYIYAASKERDNDFHLILGDLDATATGDFLNAEISGLPDGGFRAQLQSPRQAFKAHFGDNVPGRSYDTYDPPIQVTITGSIFWDIDHKPGVVGPGALKPQTSWEIHPISTITFTP